MIIKKPSWQAERSRRSFDRQAMDLLDKIRNEFIARSLASRDKAKQSGEYYSADDVLASLDSMLTKAVKS